MRSGPGLPPVGDDQLRLPRPGGGRHWVHVDIDPRVPPGLPLGTVDRQRCTGVPARVDRPPPQPCGPRRRVGRRAASPERGRPGSLGGGDGRRRRRVGRTGRPPGTDDRHAAPGAARRRDRDERCRQLRGLAQPRVPVPQAGHLPGSDVGCDGLRAAGRDRRGAGPPRSAGGRARGRWRSRDDPRRARNRRARACPRDRGRLRQPALRHDPDVAGAAGQRPGFATELGPVDFAAIAPRVWRAGRRGAR